jgi:hypothetical protein
MVNVLIAAGVTTDNLDFGFDISALEAAVYCRHIEVVKVLIAAGVDVNRKSDSNGKTAIEKLLDTDTRIRPELEIADILIEAGIADILIEAGADISLEHSKSLLRMAVKIDDIKMFKTLISHLNEEFLSENKVLIQEFENHHNNKQKQFSIMKTMSNAFTTLNEVIKQYDPLQILRGADAATVNDHSEVMIASAITPTSQTITNTLPRIDDKAQTTESQVTQRHDARFADTINEKIFIGTAALAMAMKALGQNTDWAKTLLGNAVEVKHEASFDPKDLLSHMNPKYDYSELFKEAENNAPPLEKSALERINEIAKSEETSNLSTEQWQHLIKNDKKLKAFLQATLEKVKIRETNSRPLTQDDLSSPKNLIKKKEKQRK